MNLNAGIILAGQAPDIVGSASRGVALDEQQRAIAQQNRLAQVYAEYGPAALQGNQNALAQVAGVDFGAANQVLQQNRAQANTDRAFNRTVQVQDRQFANQERDFAIQMQQQAAAMSAQERAAEAEQIKRGVHAASGAQTPEQWDQTVTALGQPDLVGQFGNKDALLRQYMTAAQILEADAPPQDDTPAAIRSLEIRAQRAGLTPGSPEYQQFMLEGGKSAADGFAMDVSPDGGVSVRQGGATIEKPLDLTVEEGKNSGFLIRTRNSNSVLDELEAEGTDVGAKIRQNIPFGVGNFFQTPEFQKYDQARRDFVNAVLRRESGAVISVEEFENANQQYFPQPGDAPEVIAQKRRNRVDAIAGLELGAGEGAGSAIVKGRDPAAGQPPQSVVDELGENAGVIWENMTPEQRRLFE